VNAVERLLAHGEQVLSLFDEMFIDRMGSGRPADLPDVPPALLYAFGHMVIDTMPTGQYWISGHWLQAALEAAWLEMKKPRKPPSSQQLASRAADLFRGYLANREQILASATWRRLLADVVFESREWSPLAAKVVSLAEQVAAAVRQVEKVPGDIEPLDWERHKRAKLRQALDLLYPYAQPPRPATPGSEKQTSTAKQKKRRDRKGVGGRPERYSLKFIREVVNARERDRKHAAKGAGRLTPFPRWLSDYCTGKGIDIREKFPPKTPGEVWSDTANRFWKAAKKRLREAETNRH